jgi:hypothetical protein
MPPGALPRHSTRRELRPCSTRTGSPAVAPVRGQLHLEGDNRVVCRNRLDTYGPRDPPPGGRFALPLQLALRPAPGVSTSAALPASNSRRRGGPARRAQRCFQRPSPARGCWWASPGGTGRTAPVAGHSQELPGQVQAAAFAAGGSREETGQWTVGWAPSGYGRRHRRGCPAPESTSLRPVARSPALRN